MRVKAETTPSPLASAQVRSWALAPPDLGNKATFSDKWLAAVLRALVISFAMLTRLRTRLGMTRFQKLWRQIAGHGRLCAYEGS